MQSNNQQVDWDAKITEVIQKQYGFKPKFTTQMYMVSDHVANDTLLFPHRYKIPDCTKFSGQDETSTVEHINWIIIHCGEAANQDALRVWLFSISLSGSPWLTSFPANSIIYWADLEKQFHQVFYSGIFEKKLSYLTSLSQRNDETVATYIHRFWDVKNRCNSLALLDYHLVDLAFQGLLQHIKEKYDS